MKKKSTEECLSLNSSLKKSEGFTLVELAIVLVVIGAIIAMGVGLMGPLIKQQKMVKTRKVLETIKEAIIGYAITHRSLPPDLSVLGVRTSDGFGKEVLFLSASISDICQDTTTPLSLLEGCSDSSCSSYQAKRDNIAFVVVSGSENQNIQTNNISNTIKTYLPEVEVDDYDSDFKRVEKYDDLSIYVSLYELKGAISCSATNSSCSLYQGTLLNYTPSSTKLSYRIDGSCYPFGRRETLSDQDPDDTLQVFYNSPTCSNPAAIVWEAKMQDADINGDCTVDLKCYLSGGSVICINQ